MMNPLTSSHPYIRGGAAGLAAGTGSGLLELLGSAVEGPLDMLNEPRRALFRMLGAPSGSGTELLFGDRPTRALPSDPSAGYPSSWDGGYQEGIPPPAEEMPYPVWQEALGGLADFFLDPVNLATSGASFLARSIPQSARLARQASKMAKLDAASPTSLIAPPSRHLPPAAEALGISAESPLIRALRTETAPMSRGIDYASDRGFSPASMMSPEYLQQQMMLNPDKMINYEVSPLQQALSALLEDASLAPPPFKRSPGVHGYAGGLNPWQ